MGWGAVAAITILISLHIACQNNLVSLHSQRQCNLVQGIILQLGQLENLLLCTCYKYSEICKHTQNLTVDSPATIIAFVLTLNNLYL